MQSLGSCLNDKLTKLRYPWILCVFIVYIYKYGVLCAVLCKLCN